MKRSPARYAALRRPLEQSESVAISVRRPAVDRLPTASSLFWSALNKRSEAAGVSSEFCFRVSLAFQLLMPSPPERKSSTFCFVFICKREELARTGRFDSRAAIALANETRLTAVEAYCDCWANKTGVAARTRPTSNSSRLLCSPTRSLYSGRSAGGETGRCKAELSLARTVGGYVRQSVACARMRPAAGYFVSRLR